MNSWALVQTGKLNGLTQHNECTLFFASLIKVAKLESKLKFDIVAFKLVLLVKNTVNCPTKCKFSNPIQLSVQSNSW